MTLPDGVRWVSLTFVDVFGLGHAVTLPAERFEVAVERGEPIDGSVLEGRARRLETDMLLVPLLAAAGTVAMTFRSPDRRRGFAAAGMILACAAATLLPYAIWNQQHFDRFAPVPLAAATGNLKELTDRLNRGEGTAGKLITDPALFNRLNSVTDRFDQLQCPERAFRLGARNRPSPVVGGSSSPVHCALPSSA